MFGLSNTGDSDTISDGAGSSYSSINGTRNVDRITPAASTRWRRRARVLLGTATTRTETRWGTWFMVALARSGRGVTAVSDGSTDSGAAAGNSRPVEGLDLNYGKPLYARTI